MSGIISEVEKVRTLDPQGFFSTVFKEYLKNKRFAYHVKEELEKKGLIFYIPVNRMKTPYQTEKATDWEKVKSMMRGMLAGEIFDPVIIGYDYDIHDGHHRYLAAVEMGHTHVPCAVGGTNLIEVNRAKENYRELWKSIVMEPSIQEAFPDHHPLVMFRGIGQKELDFIKEKGFIKSKGKGNYEDQDSITVYTCLRSQAEGFARMNYDQYEEKQAYLLVLWKHPSVYENEMGELETKTKIPAEFIRAVVPVPQEVKNEGGVA